MRTYYARKLESAGSSHVISSGASLPQLAARFVRNDGLILYDQGSPDPFEINSSNAEEPSQIAKLIAFKKRDLPQFDRGSEIQIV